MCGASWQSERASEKRERERERERGERKKAEKKLVLSFFPSRLPLFLSLLSKLGKEPKKNKGGTRCGAHQRTKCMD